MRLLRLSAEVERELPEQAGIHRGEHSLGEGEYHWNSEEEFVTAGGINLKEINFKTMESKILSNLYFAGEIVNIDAITGGFNFQNAWTSGYIVANSLSL